MGGCSYGSSGRDPFGVEQFIQENWLDQNASDSLRNTPPAVQQQVIGLGTLVNCSNPSSACLGRIRTASSGGGDSAGYGVMQQAAPFPWASPRLQSSRYRPY